MLKQGYANPANLVISPGPGLHRGFARGKYKKQNRAGVLAVSYVHKPPFQMIIFIILVLCLSIVVNGKWSLVSISFALKTRQFLTGQNICLLKRSNIVSSIILTTVLQCCSNVVVFDQHYLEPKNLASQFTSHCTLFLKYTGSVALWSN